MFAIRLRVQLGKSLTSDDLSLEIKILGRPAILKSEGGKALRESKWVSITVGGFPSERDALSFGELMRHVIEIAALREYVGVNTGDDRASTWVSDEFARALGILAEGERLHPNVHGLIVIPDDERNRFPISNASATVSHDPEKFADAIAKIELPEGERATAAISSVRLLNSALMTNDPLARLAIAIAMVEGASQGEDWSSRQRDMIENAASTIECESSDIESEEVALAIRRHSHRLSLRQGVRRELKRLGLHDLLKPWDELYGKRSAILHGKLVLETSGLHSLSNEALSIAWSIAFARLVQSGVVVPGVTPLGKSASE